MKWAILLWALASCARSLPTPSSLPEDDGGEEDGARSICEVACAKLRMFGCPEADPSAFGTNCIDVCRNAGPMADPACVVRANNLSDLHACRVRCTP